MISVDGSEPENTVRLIDFRIELFSFFTELQEARLIDFPVELFSQKVVLEYSTEQ